MKNSLFDFYNSAVKGMATTVAVSGSLVIFIVLTLQYNEKKLILTQQANSISKSVRSDMLSGNTSYVYEICRSIFSDQGIDGLRIRGDSKIFCDLKKNRNSPISISLSVPILFNPALDATPDNLLGWVELELDATIIAISVILSLMSLLSIIVFFFRTNRKLQRTINAHLVQPLTHFSNLMTENPRNLEYVSLLQKQNKFDEISNVMDSYSTLVRDLDETEIQLKQESKRAAFVDISRQVAHDIRSPLSALNVLAETLNGNDEQKKIALEVVRRINKIADELLQQSKNATSTRVTLADSEIKKVDGCSVISTLRTIISHKTIEYQHNTMIEISLRENGISDGILVNLSENSFARIISNLINNSVEAASTNGKIIIDAHLKENIVLVSVIDFGNGIDDLHLDALRTHPRSYGKEDSKSSGSGIGLSSAKRALEAVNGDLRIDSKVGIGTQVTISIPLCEHSPARSSID